MVWLVADRAAGPLRVPPVRTWHGRPPVVRIGQAHPVPRCHEHGGKRDEQLWPGAGVVPGVGRLLGCGDMPGLAHEPAEFPVGDRAGIDPESADRDRVGRGFLGVVTIRAHGEGRARYPHHAVGRRRGGGVPAVGCTPRGRRADERERVSRDG